MITQGIPMRTGSNAIAPRRPWVKLINPRGKASACPLLFAFCLLLTSFGDTATGQTPNANSVPAGEVSKQANGLILQGFDLLSQHDAAGAERVFRQAIDVQPEVEAAHRGLALALRDQGRGRFDFAFSSEEFMRAQVGAEKPFVNSEKLKLVGKSAHAARLPA